MSKSIVGIGTRGQAESLVNRLQNELGIASSEISILLPDTEGTHDFGHVKASKAPEGATTGAVAGGLTGGVLGLLAGIGALAIPGVGPFIAAGPIMAALGGGALGATAGGCGGIGRHRYHRRCHTAESLIGAIPQKEGPPDLGGPFNLVSVT
jgi:hypothetical protein